MGIAWVLALSVAATLNGATVDQGEGLTPAAQAQPAALSHVPFNVSLWPPVAVNRHKSRPVNNVSLALAGASCAQNRGVALALGFNNAEESSTGGQLAGVFNRTGGDVLGFQAAYGFNWAGGSLTGFQAARGFNWVGGSLIGWQTAWGMNRAGNVQGAQVAGLFNKAGVLHGAQVGLVNYAQEAHGAQFGLLSLSGNNRPRVQVWSDESGYLQAGVRSGTDNGYTLMTVGVHSGTDPYGWSLGFGVGGRGPVGPVKLGAELLAMKYNENTNWDSRKAGVAKLRLLAWIPVGGVSLFVGPTANLYAGRGPVSDKAAYWKTQSWNVKELGDRYGSDFEYEDSDGHKHTWDSAKDYNLAFWPGVVVGLDF